MKIICTFCGKGFNYQRGLNIYLRTCKPIYKGPSTCQKNRVPRTIFIKAAKHKGTLASDDNKSESSLSMMMQHDLMDIEESASNEELHDNVEIQNNIEDKHRHRTHREKVEIEILNFCEQIQAPIYGYDMLMSILSNCNITNDTFVADFTRRKVLIDKLKNETEMGECAPTIKEVRLDNGKKINVTTCPLLPSIQSLLNDPRCMKDENLTFPNDNPYAEPTETGMRDELHSGTWYRNAWKEKYERDGDFVLALYLFIDKTFTDVYGRLNFEPVQFTLSIFNRQTRNRYHAWRPMGYINDLKTIHQDHLEPDETTINNELPRLKESEMNMRDYHCILDVILSDLRKLQNSGKLKFKLKYRGNIYNLNLIPVLGPIIGDTSGHDVLVGRYSGRTNVKRICRYCDCHYLQSDDPDVGYEYTKQGDIKEMYVASCPESKKKLNDISYHYVRNALHYVDCGSDPRGIHGLCPVELLHCIRLGIFKIAAECFADLLTPKQLSQFDKLLNVVSKQFQHQSYRMLPKTSFTGSIMNLKRKTADEWTGILLLINASLLTVCGKQLWTSTGFGDGTKNAYIKIFEKCLILEKWLQKEDGYELDKMDTCKEILKLFMKEYKSTCRRRVGNNMKLVKFHMLLHIVDDIKRLGSPQNTNGGPCESNFKPQKKESIRTQRRSNIFHEQMATRIYEQQIIRRSISDGNHQLDTENIRSDKMVSGGRFKILYDEDNMQYVLNWNRPTSKGTIYGEELIEFVYGIFFQDKEDNEIQCFTEHKVNDVIFRADCSYRGGVEWYDWAHVLWNSPEDDDKSLSILGRIHVFVDCRRYVFRDIKHVNGIDIAGGDVYAVISSLTWKQPTKLGVSTLFFKGKLEKNEDKTTYYIVPASALDSTAVVICDIEKDTYESNDNEVIVMTTCDEWKYRFYDMYEDEV